MKIYIDETSVFAVVESKTPSISGVGALVIPDGQEKQLLKHYLKLRATFPLEKGEVKGKRLSEHHVDALVEILRKNGALFEVSVIDMASVSEVDIEYHRQQQVKMLMESITPEHHPNVHEGVKQLQETLLAMPLQLYIQYVLSSDLIHRTMNHAITYYAQRQPKELNDFSWVIDAKNPSGPTKWEDWWRKVLMAFLQSKSIRDPGIRLISADYSFLEKHYVPNPDWLPDPVQRGKHPDGRPDTVMELNGVFGNFTFVSEVNYGLEMVDILTNAVKIGRAHV